MQITFQTNAPEVQDLTRVLFRDQMPYAMQLALNWTALDIRDAARRGIEERFTVRRRWVLNSVIIPRGHWATKQNLQVSIVVGGRRWHFMTKFEEGGVQHARDPLMPHAIPTEHLRPTPEANIPLSMYPKNLRLVARREPGGILPARQKLTHRRVVQWLGKRRTFVIDPRYHQADRQLWGVWQRFGPERKHIKLIWAYREKVNIPPILKYNETARATYQDRWEHQVNRAWDRAITTARPRR